MAAESREDDVYSREIGLATYISLYTHYMCSLGLPLLNVNVILRVKIFWRPPSLREIPPDKL